MQATELQSSHCQENGQREHQTLKSVKDGNKNRERSGSPGGAFGLLKLNLMITELREAKKKREWGEKSGERPDPPDQGKVCSLSMA